MSEQDKNSGGSAIEGSVMMVEKTPGGRLKQPYRPNELQDSTDIHQKRPRTSVVPSVTEELKYFTEETMSNENEKRKECEGVPFYDNPKQSITKKLTSNTDRRDPSPESNTLQSMEVEKKKGAITPLTQPIPDVESTKSELVDEKEAVTRVEEDSITEEVEELQTPEVAKKHSEWKTNQSLVKKKEISWNNDENIHRDLTTKKSEASVLNRKASVGPCFKNIAPFEGPSGISICLPKKSSRCVNQSSGINVNISRKCLGNINSRSTANEIGSIERNTVEGDKKSEKRNCDIGIANFFGIVRDKVTNVQSKIKSIFHS